MNYDDPRKLGAACDACPLQGKTVVPPEPPRGKFRLIVIGEGPGTMEVRKKRPFCLAPESLVLMADLTWKPLGDVQIGDQIIGVDDKAPPGPGVSGFGARQWATGTVTAVYRHRRPRRRVITEVGELVGTDDHLVLVSCTLKTPEGIKRQRRWVEIGDLIAGKERRSAITFIGKPWVRASSYDAGWFAGFLDGEGYVLGSKSTRVRRSGIAGFVQNEGPVLERAQSIVAAYGFETRARERSPSRTYKNGNVCVRCDMAGGVPESLRFLGTFGPIRLIENMRQVLSRSDTPRPSIHGLEAGRLLAKEKLPVGDVIDITTTCGTFIANGFVVHNCGPTGKMLDGLLREAGLFRADCHLTNATLCQPNGDDKYELETAVACCSGRLAREIAALPPEIPILSLGAGAARLTIGKSGILKYRGFVWKAPEVKPSSIRNAERLWEKRINKKRRTKDIEKALNAYRMLQARQQIAGRIVIPTVHPAMILRGADTWLPVLRTDVKRAARLALGKLRLDQLADTGKFQVVSTVKEAKKALRGFSNLVNLDLETDSPDPMRAKITCCGIADVNDLDKIVLLSPWKPAFGPLVKAFVRKRTVVTHNGPAFDVVVCAERHGIVFGKNEDTLIAHRAFASHMPQALAHVGSVYTDTGPWKIRFKTTEEKGAVAGFGVKEDDLPEYCAADVRIGSLCWTRMQPDLKKVEALYREDMALAEVYTRMQRKGLYVDEARRQELMRRLKHRASALIGEMRKHLRRPSFKPTPIEIRRALYKQLKAPLWLAPFTPTGLPSTSKLVLESLRGSEDYPAAGRLADLLTRWRSANDARSEYLDVYIHTDGRVHASWKQVETGRPATRNPNLLNIPRMETCTGCGVLLLDGCKHGKWKKKDGVDVFVECKKREEPQPESQLRDIYCAPPGKCWVYFDLKQAELVFAAYLSGDPNFIEACKGDPHTENACILFPDGADMIRADPKGAGARFRQIGKTCGLAVGYGAEAAKVFATLRQNEFDVDMDQVETMLDRLKERYKVFFGWAHSNVDFMNRHGYLELPFNGRRRWVGFHAKPNLGFNSPVQAAVAAIMAKKILELEKRKTRNAELILYHYDALIYEVPVEERADMMRIISDAWKEPIHVPHNGLSWVQKIDMKDGERWSQL